MNHYLPSLVPAGNGAAEEHRDVGAQQGFQRGRRATPQTKVLIIDPDAVAAALLRGHLILRDFLVETATRAEESIAIAQLFQPDLVILDLDIMHGHGIELATELRDTVCADTPIIATSEVPAMLRAASLYGLFHAYWEKPLQVDAMVTRIEGLTRR